jgi:hypothetical protein
MSPSVRPTPYDLLGDHFDLSSELKHEAPPYLPKAPPTYKLKPVRSPEPLLLPLISPLIMDPPSQHRPHGHQLRAINGELSPSAGPEDPSKLFR